MRSKETILKEMAAKLSKLSQHFFFDIVQELSNSTSYSWDFMLIQPSYKSGPNMVQWVVLCYVFGKTWIKILVLRLAILSSRHMLEQYIKLCHDHFLQYSGGLQTGHTQAYTFCMKY
jgi:hypothetical protein